MGGPERRLRHDNDLDPLVLDLVEWIAREPRSYADVMDAWRTSCPRLTVWEDACERGFVKRDYTRGRGAFVDVTTAGLDFLAANGRAPAMRLAAE